MKNDIKAEIGKLIDSIIEKSEKPLFSTSKSDSIIGTWYVIAELRRILLYTDTKVDVITIDEPSDLQKKYDRLFSDYVNLQKDHIELQNKELQRLR